MLDLGLLVVRVAVGLYLAAHGSQKLFGWFGGSGPTGTTGMLRSLGLWPARFWATVAALAEVGGGLLIGLGLLGPVGPMLVLAVMIAAMWLVHRPHGFWAANGGIELPALIGVVAVALSLTGFGRYALDRPLDLGLHEPEFVAAALIAAMIGALTSVASIQTTRRSAAAPAGA